MAVASRKAKVFLEDTLRDKQTGKLGVVAKVWHDIENGSDQSGYALTDGAFEVGVLQDHGAFSTYDESEEETPSYCVGHEDHETWELVDRSFKLGDVCKSDSSSSMSGVVQRGSMALKVRNLATRQERDVSSAQVQSHVRVDVGEYVVMDDWVGKVRHVQMESIVKFPNGAAAKFLSDDLDPYQYSEEDFFFPIHYQTGTVVNVSSKAAMKRGVFSPSTACTCKTLAVVCVSYPSSIEVDWLFQNMMTSRFQPRSQPDSNLSLSNILDGSLVVRSPMGSDLSYQVGDTVTFCDEANEVHGLEFYAESNTETLKVHCKEWEVVSTLQTVTVKWQDGSQSEHLSRDLVPYLNVDDLDLWPTDNVVSMTTGEEGIVLTVVASDRTAMVKWASGTTEEMSLYELRNNGAFNIDLGDLALLIPEDGQIQESNSVNWGPGSVVQSISGVISSAISRYLSLPGMQASAANIASSIASPDVTWFGQVVSIDEDAICKVLLAYAKQPTTISVPLSRLVHVSSDATTIASGSSETGSDLDIDSTDSDSDAWEASGSEMEIDADDVASPWVDPSGRVVEDERVDDWEDATEEEEEEMRDGDSEGTHESIDVEAEEIAAADETDIVIGVEARSTADRLQDQPLGGSSVEELLKNALPSGLSEDAFPTDAIHFAPFIVLDSEPVDHTYRGEISASSSIKQKRIHKEYQTLNSALPAGILVRTYESRTDLLRIIIIGPLGTPYEYAPMLFDCFLPADYPNEPPQLHFHSWTNGIGRINPNLYEDGKVCLSLIGTWHANTKSETWSSNSTLLQVFVSLQALVLVREPYYNEAGYDALSGKDTAVAAANYSERAYVLTRGFVSHALRYPVAGLEKELHWLYLGPPAHLHLIVSRTREVVARSDSPADTTRSTECIERVSKGALILLKRALSSLESMESMESMESEPSRY